jgi:dephospho-CoA kinase
VANFTKLIVGLTGGIGSGKSTVGKFFTDLGIVVVDADQLAREVVEPGSEGLAAIREHFGENILLPSKSLDRAKLREIVFAKPNERQWLEELTHPQIGKLLVERIQSADSSYVILESPLLLETSQKELVDRILVVDVDQATQIARAITRDGSTEETIKAIIAAQIPRDARLAAADDVVDNELSLETVEQQINELHQNYLHLVTTS